MNKKILRGSTVVLSSSLLGAVLPSGVSSAFPWGTAISGIELSIILINLLYTRCSRRAGQNSAKIIRNDHSYLKIVKAPSDGIQGVKKLLKDHEDYLKRAVPGFEDFFDLSYDEKRNVYSGKLKFLGKEMFDVKLSSVRIQKEGFSDWEVILEIGENFKARVYEFPLTFAMDLCKVLKSVEGLIKTGKFDWDIVESKKVGGNKVVSIELTPRAGFTIKSDGETIKKMCLLLTDDVFGWEGACFVGSEKFLHLSSNDPFSRLTKKKHAVFFEKISEGIENSNDNDIVRLEKVFDD